MEIIDEVKNSDQLRAFVKFPFQLYKDSPFWVPPLINEELATFDRDKNPAFADAKARLFIAYKDGRPVGRIAIIINWIEVEQQKLRKIRFGWFDFINDLNVSQALLKKVEEIGRQNNLVFMEGPVGFSNLDKVGVLTEGYEEIGTMITWYNHAYYQKHYEAFGMQPEKEYVENKFPYANIDPKYFAKANELVKRRYGVRPLSFTKTAPILARVNEMFDLFNLTYSKLSSFVPITHIQKEYIKKKYISFINPEMIKFVVNSEDKLIAFAIVMPSFSKALQKAKGKLWPIGFLHLLRAKRSIKDVIFYLIGIHPDYQQKGVTAIIFNEYYNVFKEKNIEMCFRSPELTDNIAIRQLWKNFNPVIYKRRRTYKKALHYLS